MAIFIDVFYPENSKISNRLSELVSDCQTLFADASVHKEEIETKLETCNKIIKEAYEKLSKTPPPLVSMEESGQCMLVKYSWIFLQVQVLFLQ